jgi:hypothetical protein
VGQLSDNDLADFRGVVDKLVGIIQQRTGETREAINDFLDQATADAASSGSRAAEAAQRYAHQAAESFRGFRTQAEIEQERYALKALRGDFRDLPAGEDRSAADAAMKAVARLFKD